MKKVIFLFLWLSWCAMAVAQTELSAVASSAQDDDIEIVAPTTPEIPAISPDFLPACNPFASYAPTLISYSSSMGYNAIYSEANTDWASASGSSLPRWIFFSANAQDYPGLMHTESGALGITGQNGKFGYNAYVGAIKYAGFNYLETSYYIGGQASYAVNPKLSFTVFGTYFSRNSYYGMAAYPYIPTTNFGGYMTISPSSTFSLSLGAKSYYDPFARRMEVDPIIAPTVKVGNVHIGVDVGHAAKSYLQSLFQSWSR